MAASRAAVVSSFTLIKGTLIEESYAALVSWRFDLSKRENLEALKRDNRMAARSETWLRDVAFVVSRRFDPAGRDRPLALLAKAGMPLEQWKPILLWHITRDEFLLRDFFSEWLFGAWEAGAFRVKPNDVLSYLKSIPLRGGRIEHSWSEYTTRRVAAALLKAAVDFGLLRGTVAKEFASFQLPDRSFLYVLHAMRDDQPTPTRMIGSRDWRLFLMRPGDVERELLRLHQFRKLEYNVAGSLTQLSLPYASALEFAERWPA